MYVTGRSRMRRLTADSDARCIRCCMRSKLGRPSSPRATTSPSSTTRREPSRRESSRSSG